MGLEWDGWSSSSSFVCGSRKKTLVQSYLVVGEICRNNAWSVLESKSSRCGFWQAFGMLFAMSRLVEDAMLMFDKTTNRHREDGQFGTGSCVSQGFLVRGGFPGQCDG
ncbi:hypothetical protein Q9233_002635 [Columba guinea]|nr:hypothetical protein Q9233_002635 [Columba guinea]